MHLVLVRGIASGTTVIHVICLSTNMMYIPHHLDQKNGGGDISGPDDGDISGPGDGDISGPGDDASGDGTTCVSIDFCVFVEQVFFIVED